MGGAKRGSARVGVKRFIAGIRHRRIGEDQCTTRDEDITFARSLMARRRESRYDTAGRSMTTRRRGLPIMTRHSGCMLAIILATIGPGSIPAVGQDRPAAAIAGESFPVAIRVDASKPRGEMQPVWRFFGHDEPNYTYMKDGKKLLSQLADLSPQPVYIRTHNLLTSGDGTPALKWGSTGVYSEDADGNPRYDWTILDRIFDTYRERGVRPYVQIGFMPEALSTQPEPYSTDWTPGGKESISTGWAYPPKDYEKWAELVFQWVRHSVERYGKAEVETWYWEVWNEPNILYWRGTPEEYHKLYDYAADAVKRALPTARVGGPHVAGPRTPRGDEVPPGLPRTLPARHEPRHGQGRARRSTSSPSTPRGRPGSSTGTSGRGSPRSFRTSTGASRSSPAIPS